MLRRLLSVLTVALVMAAMMLAMAMPAFAQGKGEEPQQIAGLQAKPTGKLQKNQANRPLRPLVDPLERSASHRSARQVS